jgi:hypothetical protein
MPRRLLAGAFLDCVNIVDTNPLDVGSEGDDKIYRPGVGLTVDEEIERVGFGFGDLDELEDARRGRSAQAGRVGTEACILCPRPVAAFRRSDGTETRRAHGRPERSLAPLVGGSLR